VPGAGRKRTGRRPGPTRTRGAILDAARAGFAARGYDAVSVRSVAREAGVDPALVHRFFGSKEQLFVAALELPVAPGAFLALVRGAVDNEAAATMLREFVTREVLGRIAAVAAPDRPELRASIAGSQVVGLAMARYIVRVPPLAGADREEIVAVVGPTIQRYLTGALGSA
jgi:AcrR family transcriptional regulator